MNYPVKQIDYLCNPNLSSPAPSPFSKQAKTDIVVHSTEKYLDISIRTSARNGDLPICPSISSASSRMAPSQLMADFPPPEQGKV